MMSPRLPLHLLTHARRARRLGAPAVAATAVIAALAVATAATPVAAAAEGATERRAVSQAWNPFFDEQRPVAAIDPRRVVVTFDDASLGEWVAAADRELTAAQRTAWVRRALALQQRRLDAIAAAGIDFRVEHRYVRVLNGASIVVHGDGAQLLRSMRGVALVTPVRTVWPAATTSGDARDARHAGAAGAAAAVGSAPATAEDDAVRVAVLDTGIDAAHPAVAGRVATPFDATAPTASRRPGAGAGAVTADEHGTAVAGTVLAGAGGGVRVELLPVQVLSERPARDGVEAVLGDSDDVLAGLEYAVDPDGRAGTSDGAHVAVVASTAPYAGFAGSPEDRAVRAADALGTVVVAAAGNDGASGDAVGTVGSIAAADAALAVGAADLRARTPGADVRVRGGGIDETFEAAPVLTAASAPALPGGKLAIVAVDAAGGEVVDYLDSELRSRVAGAVALLQARPGVRIAAQVRAAADAGAIAVLVAAEGGSAAAGTLDVDGADIPAIALAPDDARDLRDVLARGERLAIELHGTTERNRAFGTVAGFSSAGPRLDGAARPDVVAPGVGMIVAARDGWRTASGTSIAAAWAAGQVAAVRAEHPGWDPALVRAAVLGTARPLGERGDRPAVAVQGAGLVDAARAVDAGWLVAGGRIDFGTIAPGSRSAHHLELSTPDGGQPDDELDIRLDDGGHGSPATPSLAGGELVLEVPEDAAEGHVGGWLVLPDHDLRIPWSATVRDAAATEAPIRAELSSRSLRRVSVPGAFASTLTVSVGGSGASDGTLGLAAIQRLEVRLVDAKGRDRGAIGGVDQALPGIYTFGVAGVDGRGRALAPGGWQLRVRYVTASDPDGTWRQGPASSITVPKRGRR